MEIHGKIFGIGLSRTGTKSLTAALNALHFKIIHYPKDETTFTELTEGFDSLTVLQTYQGITDITAVAIYPQLDKIYPDSKFILTIREKEDWLDAMQRHWFEKPIYTEDKKFDFRFELRRFLRASVYGCYHFHRQRLADAYERHHTLVQEYFRNQPEKLLTLNIHKGEGFGEICKFFNIPPLKQKFPKIESKSHLESGGP